MINAMAPIMLIGWIRNAVILLLLLTIIYGILTFINRVKEKDRLKKQHVADVATDSIDNFVTKGMVKYNKSLRAKLLLGVYLFPLAVFAVLVYFAQME